MKRTSSLLLRPVLVIFFFLLLASPNPVLSAPVAQQVDSSNPPDHPVKLIFIHHSTGGNWLADPSQNELGGGLGSALMQNNYFVNATNYGWGPDSIGDATDIPNWLDWFRSDNSPRYLKALYNEDGQNIGDFGSWPRLSADPGGENQIILFKSCFPNSDLEGKPTDPPDPEGWLSVGHAKYVYNGILKYFATRPDKLFIVITAPPLSSSTNAKNARAFNNWLVNDWLSANNYTLNNVAVFDLYNVLTSPDAHHWFHNGQVEHVTVNRNTLYYPSGDDHPSAAGNRKAAEEFIPLLNVYYNRWAATAPATVPGDNPQPTSAPAEVPEPTAASTGSDQPGNTGLLADFDTLNPSMEAFNDEGGKTSMTCAVSSDQARGGAQSLRLDFNIEANGWATCAHYYDAPQDWSSGQGLSFLLRSASAGQIMHLDVYAGSGGQNETYYYALELPPDSVNAWIPIELRWEDFHRAEWEENAGAAFEKSALVNGFAFGFPTYQDAPNVGTIWVDDLSLLGSGSAPQPTIAPANEPTDQSAPEPTTEPAVTPTPEPDQDSGKGGLPCAGSAILPLGFVILAWLLRRK
jgi:hypothetical protein